MSPFVKALVDGKIKALEEKLSLVERQIMDGLAQSAIETVRELKTEIAAIKRQLLS